MKLKINPVTRKRNFFEAGYTNLGRNMLVGVHDRFIINFIQDFNMHKFSEYPDLNPIYDLLSNFLSIDRKNFLITNGVEGAIKAIFEIYDFTGKTCVIGDPTYGMYHVYAKAHFMDFLRLPAKALNYEAITDLTRKHQIGLICLVNPMPMCDHHLSHSEIDSIVKLCQGSGTLVFLDEVYTGYGAQSFLNYYEIDDYDNLIVSSSFSKSHMLPALKTGYLISNRDRILEIESTRPSYEISLLDSELLKNVVKHDDYFRNFQESVRKKKRYYIENYGLTGNYSLNLHLTSDVSDLKERFLKKTIMVGMQKDVYFSVPMLPTIDDRVSEVLDSLAYA